MKSYGKATDAELVACALRGDGDAYGQLVSRYKRMVYSTAYDIVSERFCAEDISQDTFIDAFLQLEKLGEPAKFGPWLRGIARRKALHWVTRRRTWLDFDELPYALPARDTLPEVACVSRERDGEVRRALQALSCKNRSVAELFYFGELPVAEIARRLCLPEGTVKSRLYEARNKLKGELDYMNEDSRPLSSDFEADIREKIEELKKYYSLGEEFDKAYGQAEQLINRLPESDVKSSALTEHPTRRSSSTSVPRRNTRLLKHCSRPRHAIDKMKTAYPGA